MTLLLVDGTNALMRRATVSPDLPAADVVRDVMRRVERAQAFLHAKRVIVAFDSASSWRTETYPGYKQSRTGRTQYYVSVAYRMMTGSGFDCRGSRGYEADDVIATLAFLESGPVATLSSDNDLLSLVSDQVTAWQYAPKGERPWLKAYGPEEVRAKFGVPPSALIDFAALVGGKNDVPGVPGIGKVRAVKLLQIHGSIEGIIANAPDVLGEHASWARLARQLLAPRQDTPLTLPQGSHPS